MTSNSAFKKRVRQLAGQLGIPYTEARTRLLRAADGPVFVRPGVIVHPDPSVQPMTYLKTEAGGRVSLDRIEGAYGRQVLPPYTAAVCDALTRLAFVASIRRYPRARSHTSSKVTPDTVYFTVAARKGDQETLYRVLYQAWLGNAGPAYELADRWRAEVDPASGWGWNLAAAFGEDPGDPPTPKRAPRQRRTNVRSETQGPYADLSRCPHDEQGSPILLADIEHSSGAVSLLTGPCPLCGQQHLHSGAPGLGAGDIAGTRVPHCAQPQLVQDNPSYTLVVAAPGQIIWPANCQALTHKGTPCRKPTRKMGGPDVLCATHRHDFVYRSPEEEPVRWNR